MSSPKVLSPRETEAHYTVPIWIQGKEEHTTNSFDVVSPLMNDVCWKSADVAPEDVLKAIASSQEAFKNWSKSKPSHRSAILLKAASVMETKAAEYASYMATEMGAEIPVAQFFVLPLAIQMLRDIAGRVFSICGSVPVCQQDGQSCIVYKEPYGVTLGIVPWNAPYVFGVRSAATAIATGNTAILKASELTPRCYWAIGQAFHDAGLPAGVLNIISCSAPRAAEIVTGAIRHDAVRKVNFTGSAAVGRQVARVCGESLKPCLMELGGKNSTIVLEDADLVQASQACLAGSFINAGQICMATDNIIVQEKVAAEFRAIMKDQLTKTAEESSLPKVVSMASKSRLQSILSQASAEGAIASFGMLDHKDLPGTAFAPTVLEGMKGNSAFWEEEAFGPIASLTVVRSVEEAVELANCTGYGLSASVFTKDLRKGLGVAKQIETGAVHINSMTIHDEPALPFGGVKNSGWGRFNAEQGMEEFLVTKSVTWDD